MAEAGGRRGRFHPALDFARLLDLAPARLACFDARGRHVWANGDYCRYAGTTAQALRGRSLAQVLGPALAHQLAADIRAALAGRTSRWEGWIEHPPQLRRHGRQAHIERICGPAHDAAGRRRGWFLALRDDTLDMHREAELRRRSTQLETIISAVDDGVNIVDAHGRLLLVNAGFLRLYGFPEHLGMPGTPMSAFIRHRLERGGHYAHESQEKGIDQLVEERVARILATTGETRERVGPPGRIFEVHRRRLPDGTLVSTYTDATPRLEAERARRAQREALRRTERLGAAASLLGGVAHELNNPLAVVAAQATLLAEQAEGTPLAARAEKVREAAARCGRIVASLLRSARQDPPRRERVALPAAIEAALDLLGEGLADAGIEVSVDTGSALSPVLGDPDQVTHLLANLLGNAARALQRRPAPRRIALAAAPPAGIRPMVEIRVADNGPGIPAGLREKVFDPFFTTAEDGAGSGIGLALCRTIVQVHGGSIGVEETPGGGATLVVRLPAG